VDQDSAVDVIDDAASTRIYLTDSGVGGGGLIEDLTRRVAGDPRRFDHLVVSALAPSDSEIVDLSLRRTVQLVADDEPVSQLAATFRKGFGLKRLAAWKELVRALLSQGVSPSHSTLIALANRIFRNGSSRDSDQLLALIVERFDQMQSTTGFALDLRAACWLLSDQEIVARKLAEAVPGGDPGNRSWSHSVLLGLLWAPAAARRSQSLRASNHFQFDAPATERTLVLDSLINGVECIDVDLEDWFPALGAAIARTGRASLTSRTGDVTVLAEALRRISVEPIEVGWLQVNPRVESVHQEINSLVVEISIDEVTQ
jgi:hypothetical protein